MKRLTMVIGLMVSFLLYGFAVGFVQAASKSPTAPFCIPSAGTLGYRYSPSQVHYGIDIWTGDGTAIPGNPVYLPYPGTLMAFVKNRKKTNVQGLIFRHDMDAKYEDTVPELQVETIYVHMAIEETGESLVNQNLVIGKEYPQGLLLGHQGNQRWDERKEAGEDVITHLHFAIRFVKDFGKDGPPRDLALPYQDPSPYLGYNVNVDKGGDDLLPKGFPFPDDEVCKPPAGSNVALHKSVSVIVTGNCTGCVDYSHEGQGEWPGDITDGRIDYRPASDQEEDGAVGYVNCQYNNLMTIKVTIDLQGTYRINRIRYNIGDVQRAETWNADTMSSPLSETPTNPGSPFQGAWTEQSGDATLSKIDIVFTKTRTTYPTDWLFIGEIEVYGTPVSSEARIEESAPEPIDWKEYKLGALSFSVPSDWKVVDLQTLKKYKSEQPPPPLPSGREVIECEDFYCAGSTEDYTDKRYISLTAGVAEAFRKDVESGKTRIVHYGMSGGKKVEELGTTSRTISLSHIGYLIDSFKAEIAGLPVTVCILRLTGKEGIIPEGIEFTNWSFTLFTGGKHYSFILTGADPAVLSTFFKQLVSRIRLSPEELETRSSEDKIGDSRIVFLRGEAPPVDEEIEDQEGYEGPPQGNAWVAGIDGKNPTKITSSGWVSSASWLNSETVAVVSERDVWLVQITKEGKRVNAVQLTRLGDVDVVSCSPDGEWVFFTRYISLCKIRKDGTGYQLLKDDLAYAAVEPGHAVISVSREKVFYVSSSHPEGYEYGSIRMTDFEGRNERLLYKAPDDHIIWSLISSKDGGRIIFLLFGPKKTILKELDIQSLKERIIEDSDAFDLGSFMPGEKAILCAMWSENDYRLFILGLEQAGRQPKLLIRDAFDADVWY